MNIGIQVVIKSKQQMGILKNQNGETLQVEIINQNGIKECVDFKVEDIVSLELWTRENLLESNDESLFWRKMIHKDSSNNSHQTFSSSSACLALSTL